MKLHALLSLCLTSTLHAADQAWLSTGEFQWQSSPQLIGLVENAAEHQPESRHQQAQHQHHGALFQEAVESISSGGIAKP
jgi:hypothetical protein